MFFGWKNKKVLEKSFDDFTQNKKDVLVFEDFMSDSIPQNSKDVRIFYLTFEDEKRVAVVTHSENIVFIVPEKKDYLLQEFLSFSEIPQNIINDVYFMWENNYSPVDFLSKLYEYDEVIFSMIKHSFTNITKDSIYGLSLKNVSEFSTDWGNEHRNIVKTNIPISIKNGGITKFAEDRENFKEKFYPFEHGSEVVFTRTGKEITEKYPAAEFVLSCIAQNMTFSQIEHRDKQLGFGYFDIIDSLLYLLNNNIIHSTSFVVSIDEDEINLPEIEFDELIDEPKDSIFEDLVENVENTFVVDHMEDELFGHIEEQEDDYNSSSMIKEVLESQNINFQNDPEVVRLLENLSSLDIQLKNIEDEITSEKIIYNSDFSDYQETAVEFSYKTLFSVDSKVIVSGEVAEEIKDKSSKTFFRLMQLEERRYNLLILKNEILDSIMSKFIELYGKNDVTSEYIGVEKDKINYIENVAFQSPIDVLREMGESDFFVHTHEDIYNTPVFEMIVSNMKFHPFS